MPEQQALAEVHTWPSGHVLAPSGAQIRMHASPCSVCVHTSMSGQIGSPPSPLLAPFDEPHATASIATAMPRAPEKRK